jgi:hypothetical protein
MTSLKRNFKTKNITRYLLIIILILKSSVALSQAKDLLLLRINFAEIQDKIQLPPNIASSYKWKDHLGDNYLILTRQKKDTSIQKTMYGGKWRTGYIEVFHFLADGTSIQLLKYLKENTEPCDGSYVNNFIDNSIMLTDLNKDGIGEVTLQYMYACRSDPSPAKKTLIFMENGAISRLNGYMMNKTINGKIRKEMNFETHIKSNPKLDLYTGYYNNERDFESKSTSIKTHIRKQWNRHIYETNF